MQGQSKGSAIDDPVIVERSIVLELLRDDREEWWSLGELEHEIVDVEASIVEVALSRLLEGGVAEAESGRVRAARGTRYLDGLEMICI